MVFHVPRHEPSGLGVMEATGRTPFQSSGLGATGRLRLAIQRPDNRAHLGKARIKARLIANLDPDEWDVPPKPNG